MQNKKSNDTEIDTLEINSVKEIDSVNEANANDAPVPIVRRKFISQVGSLMAGVTLAALSLKSVRAQGGFSQTRELPTDIPSGENLNAGDSGGNLIGRARANHAYQLRVEAAQRERNVPILPHPDNGDEILYREQNYIASFTKGLRHNEFGEVDPEAYRAYLAALVSGEFSDFENLRPFQGCSEAARQRPFVNPLAGYAYELEGTDSAQLSIVENGARRPFRPAPTFASAEEAGEMVEVYWMSLLRDVPFDSYDTNSLAQEAAADLSNMSDFRGPKVNGQVTTQTLFRDSFPGCTTGPYISQFLLRGTRNNIPGVPDLPAGVSFGSQRLDQRIRNYAAGTDFLTNFTSWLDVQNGCNPNLNIPFDSLGLTYIRDGRSIGQYVRLDILYQAYFVAALILINGITLNESTSPFVFRFPFDENNPYGPNGSTIVQGGFGQFGNPYLMTLVTEPSTRAKSRVVSKMARASPSASRRIRRAGRS